MKNEKRGKDRDREKICMYANVCVYDKKEGERKLIIFRSANIRESRIKQNTKYIFYSNKKIKDKKNPKQHKRNNHKISFFIKKFLFLVFKN